MLFSRQLPLSDLCNLCRALRHNLAAGLTLRDVFRQMAQRGSPALRPIAARIRTDLEGGESLQAALERQPGVFPPLFLSLAGVGEETGNLPEVFAELEKYFNLQIKLWRMFLAQIAWPVIQFVAAIFVIAGAIFLLGIVNPSGVDVTGKKGAFDPFGLGLLGTSGAITFLTLAFGSIAAVAAGYFVLRTLLKQKALVDGFLLRLPVVGSCLHAIAMARFCLALRLTMDTGLSIPRSLRLSLAATGNEAFVARTPVVVESLRSGDDLTAALNKSTLFTTEFLHILAVAEEGGRVPEVMSHQADHYQEEAARRMTVLTWFASAGVWLVVAGFIILAVFRVFLFYIDQLNKLL
jgi:type II secretory pathway component PulF